ncbi:MAG: hypothetical protein ACOC41_05915 [Chitinivibrionales bacterium]
MVGYDSIIPPGRVGKITPQIDISKMHGGTFRNGVTILSNAKNSPQLRLTIKGSIKPIVGISKSYIRLKNNETETIEMETKKEGFQINKVVFEPDRRKKTPAFWNADAPVKLEYTLSKEDDKKNNDGYHIYTLTVKIPSAIEETLHGVFVIKTNHSERKEITVRGMLQADRG